jgi:asparagine synthase (glutamine-hydrolysing)
MCGIFGCVGKISSEEAYKCIMEIKHRGPDALNVKRLEGITLAHARLSILDTSEIANQPMTDASGRYWIVYNGEVYNFLELKDELELKGYKFKTDCDTEVVLYAYIEWGEKFQYKCNGMWAVAIWDNLEKSLFLSRDRFGVKPLYY